METVLVKILAVVLALSQVSTRPDAVRTRFDRTADQAQVLALLRDGCAHMRKVFEVEDLPLDDLVDTALADPKALTSDIKAFHGMHERNGAWYIVEHSVHDASTGVGAELGRSEWADWDQNGDLLLARGAKLFRWPRPAARPVSGRSTQRGVGRVQCRLD